MRTAKRITCPGILLALLLVLPADAADFWVTTTADGYDGFCTSHCTLREAVVAANSNATADIIHLGVGTYELSIPGTGEVWSQTGDLDLRTSMEIVGMGPERTIIDANSIDRVLNIQMGGVEVAIRGVTLTGGWVGSSGSGAGFNISSAASLITIQNCIIEENYSTSSEPTSGGGIYFNGNSIASTLNISHSTIRRNSAGNGGGLYLRSSSAIVNIERSTIANNTTFNGTGTIDIAHATVTIDTTTVSNNYATTGDAGIKNIYGDVTITGCTLADNTGAEVVAGYGSGGLVTFHRTIIDGHCDVADPVYVDSTSFNLESPGNTCDLEILDKINIVDTKLDALGWNGGPTLTRQPQSLSPAVDPLFAIDPTCPGTDQRGMRRPHDGESDPDSVPDCDIGAVERAPGSIFNDDFECAFTTSWSNVTP